METFSIQNTLKSHLHDFLEAAENNIPSFCKKELEEALKCRSDDLGYTYLRCLRCQKTKKLYFSCKKRGFCYLCGIRRMNEKAEILLESLPRLPYRQWVLTFPRKLRYLMAYNHDIERALHKIIIRTMREYVNSISMRDIEFGTVSFVQRFGSGLNLNIHFHILVTEGGYYLNKRKRAKFLKIRPLVIDDINQILHAIILATERLIKRKVKSYETLEKKDIDLYADSIRNMISFAARAGEHVRKLVLVRFELKVSQPSYGISCLLAISLGYLLFQHFNSMLNSVTCLCVFAILEEGLI